MFLKLCEPPCSEWLMERKSLKHNPQYSRNALLIFPFSFMHTVHCSKKKHTVCYIKYHHSNWSNLLDWSCLLMHKLLVFCACALLSQWAPQWLGRSSQGMWEQACWVLCVCAQVFPLSRLWEGVWQRCCLSLRKTQGQVCNYCTITGHTAILFCIHILR